MKKSQVSHVFVFALGIVIVALIMIFGYKVVKELGAKGEETELIRFKTQLVSDVKITQPGDVYEKSYTIPRGYSEVCFVDDNIEVGFWWCSEVDKTCTEFSDNHGVLHNAIVSKVKDNVFLVGKSGFDSIFVGKIDLGKGLNPYSDSEREEFYAVYCFEIKNSKLNIILERQGEPIIIRPQS